MSTSEHTRPPWCRRQGTWRWMKVPSTRTSAAFLSVLMLQGFDCQVTVGRASVVTGSCACLGSNQGFNTADRSARFRDVQLFPPDYGTTCKAWDRVDCPKAWPMETYGPWCCASWCYVSNAACIDAIASVESPGLFYAYFGPCGVDVEQVNATNCLLHHDWDGMSSRATGYLEHVLTYAVASAEGCGEEEVEDMTALKTLSYILGIAIIGSGFGVLLFVWLIRCDPRKTHEWLRGRLSASSPQRGDKVSEQQAEILLTSTKL